MGTWHSKQFGDGTKASEPSTKVQQLFAALAVQGLMPQGAAVFSRYDRRANVVTLWFTPDACLLAASMGATSCDKPEPVSDLSMLAGDVRCMAMYFPGFTPSRRRS